MAKTEMTTKKAPRGSPSSTSPRSERQPQPPSDGAEEGGASLTRPSRRRRPTDAEILAKLGVTDLPTAHTETISFKMSPKREPVDDASKPPRGTRRGSQDGTSDWAAPSAAAPAAEIWAAPTATVDSWGTSAAASAPASSWSQRQATSLATDVLTASVDGWSLDEAQPVILVGQLRPEPEAKPMPPMAAVFSPAVASEPSRAPAPLAAASDDLGGGIPDDFPKTPAASLSPSVEPKPAYEAHDNLASPVTAAPPAPKPSQDPLGFTVEIKDSQSDMAVSGWGIEADDIPKAPQTRPAVPNPVSAPTPVAAPAPVEPVLQPTAPVAPPAAAPFPVQLKDSHSDMAVSGWAVEDGFHKAPEAPKPAPMHAAPAFTASITAPMAVPVFPAPVAALVAPPMDINPPPDFAVDPKDSQTDMAVSGWGILGDPTAAPSIPAPASVAPPDPVVQTRPALQAAPAPASVVKAPELPTPAASVPVDIWNVEMKDSQSSMAVTGWDVPADDIPRAPAVVSVAGEGWQIDTTPGELPGRKPAYSYQPIEPNLKPKTASQSEPANRPTESASITCPKCHHCFSLYNRLNPT